MKKKVFIGLFVLIISLFSFTNVYASCILGPNVTKDIIGALRIIRYVGPALVVALTVFESVTAVAKGNITEEGKKLYRRLMKRLIYCMLLFFIPTLIMLVGNMTGVLSNDECLRDMQSGQVHSGNGGNNGENNPNGDNGQVYG